ncbi:MAG: phage terminase small subunit P27 family [Candidatus Humimicrobiaceae bacterium]
MALVGRKPKPVALHVINGNPSKLDLGKKISETPKFKPIAPKCSPRLSKGAKKEWKRIAPELERLGLLTNADKAVFEMYCQVYSECVDLEKFININGTTYKYVKRNKFDQIVSEYEVQYPQVSQLDKKRNLLIRICAEFGLTPSSRGRMSLPNESEDETENYLD